MLDVVTIMVGNKVDLEQERLVARELAAEVTLETHLDTNIHISLFVQFATRNYKSQHIETSVQTGQNVAKMFHTLAENLIFSHGIFQPGMEVISLSSWFELPY